MCRTIAGDSRCHRAIAGDGQMLAEERLIGRPATVGTAE
jgi:hypothetical protein